MLYHWFQIIDFLKNHCSNAHLQEQLVSLGMSLSEKYASNTNHWHLAALLRLLPIAKEQSASIQAQLKLALLAGKTIKIKEFFSLFFLFTIFFKNTIPFSVSSRNRG